MRIRMLKTENGSIDGIRVQSYDEGMEYDLSGTVGARELGESFVGAGLAEEVGAKARPVDAEVVATADTETLTDEGSDAPAVKPGRKSKSQ
jgi:hypothetical protein